MARYVATVEMENPHWWDVMTSGMDDTRKGALVSSAADCAREYHDAVKAGLLPYEPALAERSIAKGTASTSTQNGHGSSAANGIAAMLSGVLNGVLNDDEAEAEAEPEWRAPEPVAEQGELADFPSLLDDRTVMHAWTAVATTGVARTTGRCICCEDGFTPRDRTSTTSSTEYVHTLESTVFFSVLRVGIL